MFSRFFSTIYRSSTSVEFYKGVVTQPSGRSWKYFIGFILLIALLHLLPLIMVLTQVDVRDLIRGAHQQALSSYPPELAITVDQNGVSINQEYPYAVLSPEWLRDTTSSDLEAMPDWEPRNAVVFVEEDAIGTVTDFYQYNALVVQTPTVTYYMDDVNSGKISAQPLTGYISDLDEPVVLTYQDIENLPVDQLTSFWLLNPWVYIPLLMLVALVVLFPLLLASNIIRLLMYSLLVFIIMNLAKPAKALSYGRTFQVSMHTITPVILLGILATWAGLEYYTWVIALVVYLVWTIVVLNAIPARTVQASSSDGSSPAARKRSPKTTTKAVGGSKTQATKSSPGRKPSAKSKTKPTSTRKTTAKKPGPKKKPTSRAGARNPSATTSTRSKKTPAKKPTKRKTSTTKKKPSSGSAKKKTRNAKKKS